MTVYVLAQLRFRNIDAYRLYKANFSAVFAKFGGKVIVADESPKVIEGEWAGDKVVLPQFADEPSAQRFLDAPECQEIAKDRVTGADATVLMLSGYPG
jgi:uncharacterized protein (DUF1330 family)